MTIVCIPYSWIDKMFTVSDGLVNDQRANTNHDLLCSIIVGRYARVLISKYSTQLTRNETHTYNILFYTSTTNIIILY